MKTSDRIMDYIIDYMTKNQYSPSVREIMDAVGVTSTAGIHRHLKRLEYAGKIKYEGKRMIYVKGYKFGRDSRYDKV